MPTLSSLRLTTRSFLAAEGSGLLVLQATEADPEDRMRAEVLAGLASSPPTISPTYLYDAAGSALYERITTLPEYYPTRIEDAMLVRLAPILAERAPAARLLELGSGSSTKTRRLLAAYLARRGALTYIPVDVSEGMLARSARDLTAAYPGLSVLGLAGRFEDAFAALEPQAETLALFLGGTLGNFPPDEQAAFFGRLGGVLAPGSRLLLGFDRAAHAGKPAEVIRTAYDDGAGVTAQFNLNVLSHLNRVLGSDFKRSAWRHVARYDAKLDRIEMHLESAVDQAVTFPDGPRFEYRAGQRILTEISRKFHPDELAGWFEAHGFRAVEHWADEREYFGLLLLERV